VTKTYDVFLAMVNERAGLLRKLTYEQLRELEEPVEYVGIEKRRGRIATIVEHGSLPADGIRVVVQGFLKFRFLPMACQVALDGFRRYPDETTAPLTREDMWEFD